MSKMENIEFMNELKQEGILLVDKPEGVSSHAVVNWVRRAVNIKKVGHTGTLDPLATGLLIMLVGRKFTKMQDQFLKQDKEYMSTGQLGVSTDTYDRTGTVDTKVDWDEVEKITKDKVLESLEKFRGKIDQTVPIFSAVKINGRKLYDLARKDEEHLVPVLPVRTVDIKELELVDFSLDKDKKIASFSIRVFCTSGTYIRSLIHDIGQDLGVGATVTQLRRTRIGDINLDKALLCPMFKFMFERD